MMDRNVHTEHCCIYHGCKYNDDDCPVASGKQPQSYLCEDCTYDGITSVDQLHNITYQQTIISDFHTLMELISSIPISSYNNDAQRIQVEEILQKYKT